MCVCSESTRDGAILSPSAAQGAEAQSKEGRWNKRLNPLMEGWAAGSQAQQRRVRKEITPWEALPQAADLTSTYSSHYQKWPMPPRNRAIKPQDERPASASRFDTRSTMQDSFQNWSGRHAGKSCRPQSAYEPKDWMQPISTTHREAFQSWGAPKRGAFRPKQAREPPAATPTGRSTAQDSFQPIMHFVRAARRYRHRHWLHSPPAFTASTQRRRSRRPPPTRSPAAHPTRRPSRRCRQSLPSRWRRSST